MDVWMSTLIITVLSVSTTKGCFTLNLCFWSNGIRDLVSKYEKGKVNITGEDVEKLCSDWQPIQDCIGRNLDSCHDEAKRATYKSVFNMFDYLCNEGKEDYMKYAECYNKPVVSTGLASCAQVFERKKEELVSSARLLPKPQSEIKSRFCTIKDEYLDCVGVKIEGTCGKAAETTFKTFIEKSLKPAIELMECKKSYKNFIIFTCIAIGLAHVAIIVPAIVWYKRKNRGRSEVLVGTKYGQV